jgi:hypothetical protein
LSPTSSPLAQFCLSALGPEVFRHLTRTRGCKHKRVPPPVFFDATAEYHRSDESSVPVCRSCFGRCMRGAEHRTIQGAATHPAIGASPAGGTRRGRSTHREQAHDRTADGGRIAQRLSLALRSRPRPRAVVFPTLRLGDGRASSAELRHLAGKPERRRVLQLGSPLAWWHLTGAPSRLSAPGHPPGCPTASSGQRGGKPFAEVTRRLPHAGCPPKWVPRRKTRSGNTTTPPMGFVSFRRGKHR